MTTLADLDTAEWNMRIMAQQLERAAAVRELREFQIEPSPADVENWLAASPRSRRRLMESWAVFNASYTK
jgi:hypothetical protein